MSGVYLLAKIIVKKRQFHRPRLIYNGIQFQACLQGLFLLLVHLSAVGTEAQVNTDLIAKVENKIFNGSSRLPISLGNLPNFSGGNSTIESERKLMNPLDSKNRYCGRRQMFNHEDEYSRIIFGLYSTHYWPWATKIQIKVKSNSKIVCNGALLNERWVITAAHCLQSKPKTIDVVSYLGALDFTKEYGSDKVFPTAKYVVHPEFSESRLSNDLALIKLDRKVSFTDTIQPICMPPAGIDSYSYAKDKVCYQTGWAEHDKISQQLKELRVVVSHPDVCNNGDDLSVHMNKYGNICITPYSAPGTRVMGAVCMGDSGGPLACLSTRDNLWYLVGTVSFGPKKCVNIKRKSWATVSSDLTKYPDWVTKTISG